MTMTVFQWVAPEDVPGNVLGHIPHALATAGLGDSHVDLCQIARMIALPGPNSDQDHLAFLH